MTRLDFWPTITALVIVLLAVVLYEYFDLPDYVALWAGVFITVIAFGSWVSKGLNKWFS